MSSFELQFIGGTGTVTGSKYLLRAEGKNILVDCGLFQGLKVLRLRNRAPLPIKPSAIDAVVLTHAHIDHSGYLPLLVKNGFRGKIYATPGTRALCGILLPDAGHLQEEDAAFLNRHKLSKHAPALPLYTEVEARETLQYFAELSWEQKCSLAPGLSFQFFHAGHIIGAAMVRFESPRMSLTFTGDLGRPHNLIMPPPAPLQPTDYLVIESTYGDRSHPLDNPLDTFENLIRGTIKRGGIVLIPSFSVGRAQEILYLVHELKKSGAIPNIPVYLNSPLSIEATRITCNFPGDHRLSAADCKALCKTAHFITTVEESKWLNTQPGPSIIISASGMATGGRVLHHLKVCAPDPKNLILFVGFQAAGTRGQAMLNQAATIKIHGEMVPVRAQVASLDSLSAHADAAEMLAWLKACAHPPRMTFITHGEPLASEALRKRIASEIHWPCKVPDYLENVTLFPSS